MELKLQNPKVYNNQQPQNVEEKKPEKKAKDKKDIYNETPIRKLGFMDEIGEAFRPVLQTSKNPIVRSLPNYAYIPSTIYMAADVYDKYKKGLDGTGEKPSVKMGLRQAAYQGIVSVAAPIAIIRGTNKVAQKVFAKLPKAPKEITGTVSSAVKGLKNNKYTKNIMTKAGMPAKIMGALASIFVLSKLSKPVDKVVSTIFEKTIDPMIGVNKNENK